jgi:hypothetical protein
MARSDKVAFRREFTLTTSGYVGDSTGFFVGDIFSLHVDILDGATTILAEGKVGREGDWETILTGPTQRHVAPLDIRSYEYVRVQIFKITKTTQVILFGYDAPIVQKQIVTEAGERDFTHILNAVCDIAEIKNELKTLNKYMEIITGDKL